MEVRERAVRLVFEHRAEYETEWAAIRRSPRRWGSAETLRNKVRRDQVDSGAAGRVSTSAEAQRIKELERENRELRRANEILRRRLRLSSRGSSIRSRSDERRSWIRSESEHGVELACQGAWGRPVDLLRRSSAAARGRRERALRDRELLDEIHRVLRSRATGSTGPGRSGGSYAVKGSWWRGARWSA